MSVAIAELTVSMNQDAFHPKIESQQNSLFEDAMREIYVQDGISSQKEILTAQKSNLNVSDPLVDNVIDPTILVGNSKGLKVAATHIVIEQRYVSTQDLPKKLLEAQKTKQNVPDLLVDNVVDLTEDPKILVENSKGSKVAATHMAIEQQYVNTQDFPDYLENELNFFVIDQQNKKSSEYIKDATRTLVIEQEGASNELESAVISIAPEKKDINIKDAFFDVGNSINTFVIDNNHIKDSNVESIPFVEGQQPNQTEEYPDTAIIKNTSFFVEIPKDFRDLHNGNDDKMLAFYPNANYMLHEKNNVDLEADDVTISDFKKLDQSLFQLNDAEFLLQNIKFQDNKLPINVENEKLLEETPQAETLKLVNHQNTNQQSVQNRESSAKIDVFPTPTILSAPDNSKEFILTSQSSTLNQANEQNQSIIGLKIGNITNQDGVQSLKISILPQELGTIKLDLKTNAETKLTEAHFTFSNQDGFDLFQGNRQDLLVLLGKSGLDIQPDKVSFDLLNFADSSSQFAHEHPKNDQDLNQKTHFFRGENNEPSLEEMKQIQNNVTATSLLNLMV
ncbi:MAG: hypothetical protein Q8L85_02060 [Alphaproteobacteria bacterium]|nr:hypothetical protein [Alphaproteobacteria bacterium]